MVFKYRIVLDVLDDVFRDIEMEDVQTLEDLHNSILQAFGFTGDEMASFYKSDDEWTQGEEISLFTIDDSPDLPRVMADYELKDVFSKEKTKMIYVYDFLNMWTFYVELADIEEVDRSKTYPNLMYSQGYLPDSPPDKQFKADKDSFDDPDDFKDDLDNLDLDNLDDLDLDNY